MTGAFTCQRQLIEIDHYGRCLSPKDHPKELRARG